MEDGVFHVTVPVVCAGYETAKPPGAWAKADKSAVTLSEGGLYPAEFLAVTRKVTDEPMPEMSSS